MQSPWMLFLNESQTPSLTSLTLLKTGIGTRGSELVHFAKHVLGIA